MIHIVKGFGLANKPEIDVFSGTLFFFEDPTDVNNLISGSSAFSKTSLNILKLTVHVLLKLGLKNDYLKVLLYTVSVPTLHVAVNAFHSSKYFLSSFESI